MSEQLATRQVDFKGTGHVLTFCEDHGQMEEPRGEGFKKKIEKQKKQKKMLLT